MLLGRLLQRLLNLSAKQSSLGALLALLIATVACLTKWVIVPPVVQRVVWNTMSLRDSTTGYKVWLSPPVPVFTKFYFFNVLNPDEVENGETPQVEELGPFTYNEYREKQDVKEIQGMLTYSNKITYEFNEKLSCSNCRESTEVTVPNAALLGAVGLIQSLELPDYLENLVLELINWGIDDGKEYKDTLFHKKNVSSILFDGYTPPVLTWLLQVVATLENLGLGGVIKLPESLSEGTFGLWLGRNGTKKDLVYTIDTGEIVRERYASVQLFNQKRSLPEGWWDPMGPTPSAHKAGLAGICSDIRGTDGQQFHPMIQPGEELWLFEPDLCRSIPVTQMGEVDIDGIPTYHYEADSTVFSISNPHNFCYCPKAAKCASENSSDDSWDLSNCRPPHHPITCKDGLFSTLGCQGAPAYGSAPHFLSGSSELSSNATIKGLKPSRELHTTFLNVEPLSGVAFQAHKRIQISFPMEPISQISILEKAPQLIFPLVWYDEGADITDEYKSYFFRLVRVPLILVDVMVVFGISASIIVLLFLASTSLKLHLRA